jgi:hypothetical protein
MSYVIRGSILALALISAPALAQSSGGSTSTSTSVRGSAKGNAQPTADEINHELKNLPHPALMESIQSALGEKSATPLSRDQSRKLAALNADFEKQVTDFLRTHKDGKGGDIAIPDRAKIEKQVLDLLNKQQRTAADKALRDTAGKRITERHHDKHTESHSDKKSGGDSHSNWQSSSSSQSSSESSSEKSSQSSHWSKLDAQQKKAVMHDLLQQLPTKDREKLAKELGLNTAR